MNKGSRVERYDRSFVTENMMGPNAMMVLEELLKNTELKRGMRVLDLGCGNALTSIYLAREYGVQVFAVDLWISATDNLRRIKQMELEKLIVPMQLDAHELPFAEGYFDAVVSVDAYHYFGNNDAYFETHLKRLLKEDGIVAIAFPGMKYEVHSSIPEEMKPFWEADALETWHSIEWWRDRLESRINNFKIHEMTCFKEAWHDWLSTDNPYAVEDRAMMKADNGRFMNLIAITGKRP